jgi:hypothetical protein
VLHLLDHLEEEGFPVAGRFFPIEGRLFACLRLAELVLEQRDHIQVDVQRVQS